MSLRRIVILEILHTMLINMVLNNCLKLMIEEIMIEEDQQILSTKSNFTIMMVAQFIDTMKRSKEKITQEENLQEDLHKDSHNHLDLDNLGHLDKHVPQEDQSIKPQPNISLNNLVDLNKE